MKIMIQFSDFYDDIDFMVALFYNRMLSNADICEIANHLNNKTSDDVLAAIVANGVNSKNNRLFDNYLNSLGIKFFNSKRAVIAKVFYYILHNRIGLNEGIGFVDHKVIDYGDPTKYLGDDVGIAQLLGKYYAIADGDVTDKKKIEDIKKLILEEMQQYVDDNLEQVKKKDL
jgi:hypothetical protein